MDPLCFDLVKKLLNWDPKMRPSAEEALAHPFLAEIHDVNEEPSCEPLDYFDFEFEQYRLDTKILHDLILDEILLYHNSNAVKYYRQCK